MSHRSYGQKQIGVTLDEKLLLLIDKAREQTNESRAAFARIAIVEHLRANGYGAGLELAKAPDRKGKGGRKKRAPQKKTVITGNIASNIAIDGGFIGNFGNPKKST